MRAAEAAGVVLAGGRSERMGRPKAALPWRGDSLLGHVVGVLAATVGGPVVVVAAPGQELPDVAAEVVRDPVEGRGPLAAVGTGLAALADRAPGAFVASVDLPLLVPPFVRRVLAGLGPGVDVVLPVAHGHHQPLAAAYDTALAGPIAELVAAGRGRPAWLFERSAVLRLDAAALLTDPELAAADPDLASLTNVNTPADWAALHGRLPRTPPHGGPRSTVATTRPGRQESHVHDAWCPESGFPDVGVGRGADDGEA